MSPIDAVDSLPIVYLLKNEFLSELEEVVEIRYILAIALTEDRSSV